MKITSINQTSRIGKEWIESIRNNHLKKGVSRFVTISTDNLTETLGKTSEGVVSLKRKAKNGASELTITHPEVKGMFKRLIFPDGSGCEVRLIDGIPKRTNGYFFLKTKDGEKVAIQYATDGYSEPTVHKNIFMANIDRLGNPKYDVDLESIFSNEKTSLLQKIKKLFKPLSDFAEKNSAKNKALREFANSIDRTI